MTCKEGGKYWPCYFGGLKLCNDLCYPESTDNTDNTDNTGNAIENEATEDAVVDVVDEDQNDATAQSNPDTGTSIEFFGFSFFRTIFEFFFRSKIFYCEIFIYTYEIIWA